MQGMDYVDGKKLAFKSSTHLFNSTFLLPHSSFRPLLPSPKTSPIMAPEKSPDYEFEWAPSPAAQRPSRIIDNLSPPLIAMFAVLGTALLIVLYARLISRQIRQLRRRWRRWRRCRHLLRTAASDFGTPSQSQFSPTPPPPPYTSTFPFSPYGLDDAAIKTLPLSIFSRPKAKQPSSMNRDCAVCLFEFDDGDWLRTLPLCTHAFHVECIDVWLRSHPSCPLCRAAVSFQSNSPFVPMRAARIRPSFDDIVLDHTAETASPILEERGRSFLLKRSYSFGFERSVGAERIATTVSPAWRLRQQPQQQRGFWSKRWQSPFGGVMKSPFVRRWGRMSASSAVMGGRRSRSMTSPSAMWMGRAGGFSSSRMRCGDPEALISPERFNRG